ncbi:MAG: HlyD family type I secretion periplasmic adaptor subunit, partial [Rickettsiales bacterium]|nr:HlyD family type I secretion periplasmic adaptor subunit [Rickettsiales bacterium]
MRTELQLPPLLANATKLAGITTLVFIVWSSFAQVDEAVKGPGRTISSGQNKIIQHMEGGIVADILVQEGQMVEKEQILFHIRNENSASTMRENTLKQESLEAAIVRLKAEIDDTPLAFPEAMQKAFPEAVKNETRQYESRKQGRMESLRILADQIVQKQHALQELTSKEENLKRELATATEQYRIVEGLQRAGATSTNRVLDAKARVERLKTESSSVTQSIPITLAELSEAKGRLEEAKAHQKNDLLEELRKATLESQQLAERLKADTDRMDRTDVAAPVKGIVNRLNIHTIGGTVRPGEALAEITPLDDSVIVEAKIAPEHRAKIWMGQAVKVKITAYEYATFGSIPGVITDISADSFSDEQSKAPYYRVKVTLDKSQVDETKKIMPGMMTEVNILTGKRSVMGYLLRPLLRVKEDAFKE